MLSGIWGFSQTMKTALNTGRTMRNNQRILQHDSQTWILPIFNESISFFIYPCQHRWELTRLNQLKLVLQQVNFYWDGQLSGDIQQIL